MRIAQYESGFEAGFEGKAFARDNNGPNSTQEQLLYAALRLLRLAGMAALLALLAGGATRVHAQTEARNGAATGTSEVATIVDGPAVLPEVAAADTGAAAPSPAAADTSAAAEPAPDNQVYQVLPPELFPSAPEVAVIAQSSVPAEAWKAAGSEAAATGKKGKKKKEKAPKLTPVQIEQGTLTIDGWTGKARLNYAIADLKYIYVWAPGIGTLVASNEKFPMGVEQKGAFDGTNLTLQANGHTIQISSEKKLLKDKKPASAWVYLDKTYKASSMYPQMGYGATKEAPYAWPGAKDTVEKGGVVAPPPLPAGMRPALAKPACANPVASATAGTSSAAAGCAAIPAKPASSPASPAAAPPVPLPGYSSGTTTAQAVPAPQVAPAQ